MAAARLPLLLLKWYKRFVGTDLEETCPRKNRHIPMKPVIVEIEDSLGLIILNRPKLLNALTHDMIGEITESVESLSRSDEIRTIAIVGRGRVFSSGCDVVSLYNCGELEIAEFMDCGRACIRAIESCPKPVIAGVDGWCLGGGFEILLASDFVFASDDAVFGFPEVKLGLIPGFGGTQLAAARLGAARAKDLIMTGRRIDLLTAFEWGIINRTVMSGDMLDSIKDFAEKLSKHSPKAIGAAKRSINGGIENGFAEGMIMERKEFLECFSDPFTKLDMAAFSERTAKLK